MHGIAMGTHMAPSYTNLVMGKLEREFLRTQDNLPQVWWRYTDDIFTIWAHGEPSLLVFIEIITRHHTTIKFTASWLADAVTFLDMRVHLRDGLIGTDLHIKPTNTHQYLRMDSCHSHHWKILIPYNQVLCL